MSADENDNKIASQMKFLLLFERNTGKRCCFVLSLRTGLMVIALITILTKIPFYFTSVKYFTEETFIPIIIFDIFSSIAYAIAFYGVIRNNFRVAYFAHITSAVSAYLYLVGGIVIIILLGLVYGIAAEASIKKYGFGLIFSIFIVVWLGNIIGYVVNHFFVYSYTKELGLGHVDLIYARELNNIKSDENNTDKAHPVPIVPTHIEVEKKSDKNNIV